jgi:hypothetical protein
MTFHDRRLDAARKVIAARRQIKHSRKRRLMKEGAFTLNLWSAMPAIEIGTIADDWKAVGEDMRRATSQYADECG